VFVDEAGNSGNNHLDHQRFYACAAWAIEEVNVDQCRAVVRSIRSQAPELKGSCMLRSARGRESVAAMFDALGKAGAVPYYVLVDKRYSLGGRVVDFFLDSTTNDRISTAWEWDKDNGRSVAAAIAELPETSLQATQRFMREGGVSLGRRVIEELAAALRRARRADLASLLEGAVPHLDEIARSHMGQADRFVLTPNFAGFVSLLQLIDNSARRSGLGELRFVHDTTTSFEGTLQGAWDHLKSLPKVLMPRVIQERFGPEAYALFQTVALEFRDSHQEPLLQAADTLAATIVFFAAGAAAGHRDEKAVQSLAVTVVGPARSADPQMALLVMGDESIRRLVVLGRELIQ